MNQTAQSAIINNAALSPYLAGELNTFATNNSNDKITIGVAGKGTFTSQNADGSLTITVDPNWEPQSGAPSQETPSIFTTTVAHELGHADLANGMALLTSNPTLAQTYGTTAEGEAVTSEYIVATQLGMNIMHSDSSGTSIMPTLTADASALGINVSQLTYNSQTENASTSLTYSSGAAVSQAGTYYAGLKPSDSPNITYGQRWQADAVLTGCNIDQNYVDWSAVTGSTFNYTLNTASQQCGLYNLTLPWKPLGGSTSDGSASINGTYAYSSSIPVSLTETVNDGSIQYTQVGTSNAAGQVTETITGTGDVLNLSGTSSLFDTINIGSGTSVNAPETTTVNGSYLNVTGGNFNILTGTGSWDNFTVGGVSSLTATGAVMNLKGAQYDTVNDNVNNSTITLSGYGTINTNANNINITASGINGSNDAINLGGNNQTITINGNYDSATASGTGNTIKETGTWDNTTIGANSGLTMNGGWDYLKGTGNDTLTCTANNSQLISSANSWVLAAEITIGLTIQTCLWAIPRSI